MPATKPTDPDRSVLLPKDLATKLPRRVQHVGLIYAVISAVAAAVQVVAAWLTHGSPVQMMPSVAVGVVSISVALACRQAALQTRATARLLNIGAVLCLLGAFGTAFAEARIDLPLGLLPRGISWVTFWITGFSAWVPSPPRRNLFNSFGAAVAGATALAVAIAVGYAAPVTAIQFVMLTLPNFIAAGMTVPTSRILYELGRELSQMRQLGSYHLVERIGSGGMGEVWRATHGILKRPAAVKLIHPHLLTGDPAHQIDLLRRFRREAEVTAALHSPHTVELYDFGVDDDGTLYYVMELLEGIDLETLVARHGPQPPARVAYVMAQVCDALAEAHAAGLVHRDIKPANVFLCRQGARLDFVKVLDFGLVKRLDQPELSTTGQAPRGTPMTMAPELISGSPVDRRVDLYALGCVAYTLLTGRPVFTGASSAAVLMQHAHATPPPLSNDVGDIPPQLERLVLDCLAKNPGDRPATAEAILHAFEPCAAQWTTVAAQHWWQQHDAALRLAE